jgi:hypothetical protein
VSPLNPLSVAPWHELLREARKQLSQLATSIIKPAAEQQDRVEVCHAYFADSETARTSNPIRSAMNMILLVHVSSSVLQYELVYHAY